MLEKILKEIIEVYDNNTDNDIRHNLASLLWTEYYKISRKENRTLDEAYNLYMMLENESYIINQKPDFKKINDEEIIKSIDELKLVLEKNNDMFKHGISNECANTILKWIVYNTRNNFKKIGVNLENNSLNGYCEIGQLISILPLEKLGLKVTKNQANICFDYPYNHCFGTVSLPILENNEIIEKEYLIDTTYRQFFTTVRCNEGRYYTKEENTLLETSPNPGYFNINKEFAQELMKKGYVFLNEKNAEYYGKPFYLSSLKKEKINKKCIDINFYEKIINDTTREYKLKKEYLEELNIEFPKANSIMK